MKKILLASTALIATAGLAAAEVTVGGDGYFGLAYNDSDENPFINDRTGDSTDYKFIRDLDIDFTATGESDGGLAFGASIDADDTPGAQGPFGWRGTTFVSGEFGTLSMGDTGGGAEAVIGDLAGVGVSGLGDFNETIFLLGAGDGNPLALYEFSNGGLSLALGISDDEGYSAGIGWDGGIYSLGFGYERILGGEDGGATFITIVDTTFIPGQFLRIATENDVTHAIGQASVTFEGFTLKGIYGQADSDGNDFDQWGISGAYGFDAWTVTAYWHRYDLGGATLLDGDNEPVISADGNEETVDEVDFYGAGVGYDLGGGLAVGAGIVEVDGTVIADLGLSFSF